LVCHLQPRPRQMQSYAY